MQELSPTYSSIPIEHQQSIRDRCFHPTGVFIEFEKEETEQSISDRFEKVVRKHPGRLAVKTKKHALSYNELNMAANRIGQAILMKRGEQEEAVSLLFRHDAPMIAAIFGVLKTGKMYVPLDSSFPRARLEYILQDSQTKLIVTDNENLPLAKELASNRHQLMNIDDLDDSLSTEQIGLSISPDSPIYILYTSGSTGQPKGVLQNHRHRLHDIMIHTNGLHICPDDRLILLYSCSTGMGATVLFSALLNGAAIYPYDLKEEGMGALSDWLIQQKITIYTSITTVLRHFFNTLNENENFPELRVIYQSGEPLYKKDADLYKRLFPQNCIMINGIGAGETARLRRYYIDQTSIIPGNIVPVGYPVEDKEVLLLDEQGNEVGFNQVGEMAIKSRYLSPGYWGKPDLTEAAYISNPEWGDKRIYLTGDLGSMSPDGCLVHMGRKDFQVKVRGNRVEIPEIEAALYNLETTEEAVVIADDDAEGERRLVAYVVPNGDPAPSVATLRHGLAETLPGYMIPSVFVFLESLPRLPNRKIDRLALPAPNGQRPKSKETFVAPRDDLEIRIAKIWEKTLKVTPVGVRDDFFELGGDSLRAISLALEIEQALGRRLPLAILCEAPTIERLARRFREDRWLPSWSSLVPLQPEGPKPPLFCVHGVGGYVLFYSDLARRLKPHQPFYGLQAVGLDGEHPPLTRVEDMAGHYIKELRSVQPQGPYSLGGFCLGTYVAVEMAQQLRDQGQKVPIVVAFDPPGHERTVTSFLGGIGLHLQRLSEMEPKQKVAYLMDRTVYRLARIRSRFISALYKSFGNMSPSLSRKLLPIHVQELSHQAGVNYVPRVYQGRLTFFLGTSDAYKHPEFFWGQVASEGIEMHMVPGKRIEILREPNVQALTRELQACLDKAQEDA